MSNVIRQYRRYLRLWLLVSAATLLLVSAIEAGHAHGIFGDLEAGCALCQHNQVLDKAPTSLQSPLIPLLVAVWIGLAVIVALLNRPLRCIHIRAPPHLLPALP